MIIVFILLWTISSIVLICDFRSESSRWLSALTFFTGCGSLAAVLNDNGLLITEYLKISNHYAIDSISGFLSSLSHHLAPYTLLMYGISNTLVFQKKWKVWKKRLTFILIIPPLIMYILFPFKGGYYPSFATLTIWVAPYVIVANALLIITYLRTKYPKERQQKLFNCIIVSPITLYALYSNFILRIFSNEEAWRFHRWFIVLQFILFVVFSARHGALGVKIKFEKHQLERTRKSISSGTAIISHTIKNEICKISMGAENIRLYCDEPNEYINDSLEIINESTNHLFAMVSRINEQMSDIILEQSYNNPRDICEKALHMVNSFLKKKNIKVKSRYNDVEGIFCDEVHIREVLINIFKNAVEAMEENGEIKIYLYREKKGVVLSIIDNGKGIPKENLEKVLDPFFTTKKHSLNFGLGLSYCYNVMEMHGGDLELISQEGKGTTVLLYFPIKRNVFQRLHKLALYKKIQQ